MNTKTEITVLLKKWSDGDKEALESLMLLVNHELHRLAESYMRKENKNHTLQPTALVNEAYLKLIDQTRVNWKNRSHFFGISAQIMRRILVDHARKRIAEKRGGAVEKVSLDEAITFKKERSKELIALEEALEELAKLNERSEKVVELKYFGGLTVDETAEVLKISKNTVVRDWNFAKAWLYRHIQKESDEN